MICDPDGIMSYEDANVAEAVINKIGNGEKPFIRAPCGDLGPRGYQVGAAGRAPSIPNGPQPSPSASLLLYPEFLYTTALQQWLPALQSCIVQQRVQPLLRSMQVLSACCSPNPFTTRPLGRPLVCLQVAVALMSKFEAAGGVDAAATAKAFARALHDSWGVGEAACQVGAPAQWLHVTVP
jgi:hypothetical protein